MNCKIVKDKSQELPDVLVLLNNGIKFNGSLLQFEEKASFILYNYVLGIAILAAVGSSSQRICED